MNNQNELYCSDNEYRVYKFSYKLVIWVDTSAEEELKS